MFLSGSCHALRYVCTWIICLRHECKNLIYTWTCWNSLLFSLSNIHFCHYRNIVPAQYTLSNNQWLAMIQISHNCNWDIKRSELWLKSHLIVNSAVETDFHTIMISCVNICIGLGLFMDWRGFLHTVLSYTRLFLVSSLWYLKMCLG